MTNKQFITNIEKSFKDIVELIKIKNADYATNSDPFKNFRSASVIGISPSQAILVRITDKLSRISNLLGKKAQVKDESIEDTLNDIIGYTVIMKELIKEKK